MNDPKISVIVPCYNQVQYLNECLQSVLDQSFQDWECIIVNDGSPDNTENVAIEWTTKDARFKYLKKENGGLSSARNAGIEMAKGEWIQFLDSDDIIEKNKLEEHAKFFNTNVDISVSSYRYFEDRDGRSQKRIMGRGNFLPEVAINADDEADLKDLFKIKNPFVISAPLYRYEIFKKVGYFDERLKSLEDWDFNLRCVLHNFKIQHIGFRNETKTLIRLHDSSMMRDNKTMNENYNLFLDICYLNDKYVEAFGDRPVKMQKTKKTRIKDYILLFVPPIFVKLKNDICN